MVVLPATNGLLEHLLRLIPGIRDELKRLTLAPGTVLYEPGAPMPYVYFPAGSVLSLFIRNRDGRSVEVSTVGSEGLAPVPVFLCVRKSPLFIEQQVPGELLRVPAAPLIRAQSENARVQTLLLCYAAYSLRMAQQTTSCNALHDVRERIARRLLMTADRAGSDHFLLTQDMLGEMLGVPRQTINGAMRALVRADVIKVRRGHIQLLNRAALEHEACECYALMGKHYRELLA